MVDFYEYSTPECYVPGEQGAGKRESVLLSLIRIAVYKIIPSLMFRLYLNWRI